MALPQETILQVTDERPDYEVVITVAGRSDALSAFADFHTLRPVIACPPPPQAGDPSPAYLVSTIDTPSGVGPSYQRYAEGAAIATAKILVLPLVILILPLLPVEIETV